MGQHQALSLHIKGLFNNGLIFAVSYDKYRSLCVSCYIHELIDLLGFDKEYKVYVLSYHIGP